jgi:predicted nucleotide-binding protein (sugar kinase/HSP70/actin superfamily)
MFKKPIDFIHGIVYNSIVFEIMRRIRMLMSLAEYAEMHGKSSDTLRRLAEHGAFGTAHKNRKELGCRR